MVRTACAEEGMVLALPILHPNKPDLTLLRPERFAAALPWTQFLIQKQGN